MKKRVLILCTGNSCRSQMAEACGSRLAKVSRSLIRLAQSDQVTYIALAIKAMQELGAQVERLQASVSNVAEGIVEYRYRT